MIIICCSTKIQIKPLRSEEGGIMEEKRDVHFTYIYAVYKITII